MLSTHEYDFKVIIPDALKVCMLINNDTEKVEFVSKQKDSIY